SNSTITHIEPLTAPLDGAARVPGDKSISHRAVLFSAMAEGTSRLTGVLDSADVRSTIGAVSALGAEVSLERQVDGTLAGGVTGWGKNGPQQPDGPIDCGNSGTTSRLLMGVLAPWSIRVQITGDESLQKRPMRRIIAPLMKMGVSFEPEACETLPVTEVGTPSLKAITYDSPMASAQLKTAVLLAGLGAKGITTINEPAISRNHTELMLPEFGVKVDHAFRRASVEGPVTLSASEVDVPGDPSSAAFLICAALLKKGSSIQIENVSLNPGRVGFIRTLERMGASIEVRYLTAEGKEPIGVIEAAYTDKLTGCEIPSQHIASEIDEIPVLALVAAHASGITVFRGVSELTKKESNRLTAIIEGLGQLGVNAWAENDDLYIEGQPGLEVPEGLVFDSRKDHRLAMTWSLVGLCSDTPVDIIDFDCVSISFPTFLDCLKGLA
ncbi:MAG: 3-phosphoshikimate 1-carboxyvinyltransferase, partial [Eggerthellaceae bacterium]|nr:3-phosphoshikimate 1-carboxyvinyltransferase [Eggerthellaceae bacterium]